MTRLSSPIRRWWSQNAGLAALALLAAASPASAQLIRGRVVEQDGLTPVIGAHVMLVDSTGRRVRSILTNEQGAFVLRGQPGFLRIQVEMISRQTVSEALTDLEPSSVRDVVLVMPVAPIQLNALDVRATQQCEIREGTTEETQLVWEEARKALTIESAVRAQGLYRFDITRFERQMDERGRVTKEDVQTMSRFTGTPFVSRPPDELAENGYREFRDGVHYLFGLNADVLLSDSFLATHCFYLTRDADHGGEIGLAFEPVRGRRLTDVQGVLWLDEMTAELRTLEFTYTRLPSSIPSGRYGGSAEFQRLPNGTVLVRAWSITSPVFQQVESTFAGRRVSSERVIGTFVEGGEVLNIIGRGGRVVETTPRAVLAGTVVDSTTGQRITDAEVYLAGTAWSSPTDPQGRFRLTSLPAGQYLAGFRRPLPNGWTYTAAPVPVRLVRGDTTRIELAVPRDTPSITATEYMRRDSIVRVGMAVGFQQNPYFLKPPDTLVLGRVYGRVTDQANARPVPAARVLLRGSFYSTGTDESGRFPPLDLPPGVYELVVEREGYVPLTTRIEVKSGQVLDASVRLERSQPPPPS